MARIPTLKTLKERRPPRGILDTRPMWITGKGITREKYAKLVKPSVLAMMGSIIDGYFEGKELPYRFATEDVWYQPMPLWFKKFLTKWYNRLVQILVEVDHKDIDATYAKLHKLEVEMWGNLNSVF